MGLPLIAGQAASMGLGLVQSALNDGRQLSQNAKLRKQNMVYDKQWAQYQQDMALKMWEATGYVGQKDQMKRAGINPALMYGMGGGGSQTIGQGSSQTGSNAPAGGGELSAMAGLGMQLGLMDAQRKNIEADTKLKEADAAKTAGVDTRGAEQQIVESKTRVDSLLQGIDNQRQEYELKKLDITLKNIENFEKQASQEDRLDYIEWQTKTLKRQWDIIDNEAYISSKTKQEKIQIIQQEAIGAVLKNLQQQAQTRLTEQEIKVKINDIILKWRDMDNQGREMLLKEMSTFFHTDPVNTHSLKSILDNIIFGLNPVKGGK